MTHGSIRLQTIFAGVYFAFYPGYLLLYQEGELPRRLSLVFVPLVSVSITGR